LFKNVSKPQLTLYFSTALLSFLQAINLRGEERPSRVLTNWICKEKNYFRWFFSTLLSDLYWADCSRYLYFNSHVQYSRCI